MSPADRTYLEEHGVEKALADALAAVVREKPDRPLSRIAAFLLEREGSAGPPPSDGASPGETAGGELPEDAQAEPASDGKAWDEI